MPAAPPPLTLTDAAALYVTLHNIVWQIDHTDCDVGADAEFMLDVARALLANIARR